MVRGLAIVELEARPLLSIVTCLWSTPTLSEEFCLSYLQAVK